MDGAALSKFSVSSEDKLSLPQ
ncbi:hypothetical protein A2U01_0052361, partial [Trifolium medium]|nr:hypothetical protein [Trifolium medium]